MQSNKKLKAGFLPTLLVFVSMLVVACSSTSNGGTTTTPPTHTKAPQDQQVLISGGGEGTSDILSFDPALAPDIFSLTAIENVFTGLVQLNDKLQVV